MRRIALAALLVSFSLPTWAACKYNGGLKNTYHFLVNGLVDKPVPEIVFNVAGSHVGLGSMISSTVNHEGGGYTIPNHVRFRLRQNKHGSKARHFYVKSALPLSCINCSSTVTIPLSKLSWLTNTSSREHKGYHPSAGSFNDTNSQVWFSTPSGKNDSIFNVQFSFDNDVIYPAGTYEGRFQTRAQIRW